MSEKAPKAEAEQKFIINVSMGNDGEPGKIFVGDGKTDYLIQRGKDVVVPKSVLHVLDNAIIGVTEVDPEDNTKSITVDRKRFPYTIVGAA